MLRRFGRPRHPARLHRRHTLLGAGPRGKVRTCGCLSGVAEEEGGGECKVCEKREEDQELVMRWMGLREERPEGRRSVCVKSERRRYRDGVCMERS